MSTADETEEAEREDQLLENGGEGPIYGSVITAEEMRQQRRLGDNKLNRFALLKILFYY